MDWKNKGIMAIAVMGLLLAGCGRGGGGGGSPSGGGFSTSWVARYNGPGNFDDGAAALAVDANGNVYVTGYSQDLGTSGDYATIKYDANGNQLWVARYNGAVNARDEATAIFVDAGGNVYVTGNSVGSSGSLDYATIKYDANGNQLWVARYDGPGNDDDETVALTVDATGNVYVTGYSLGEPLRYAYATIKYDANGNQLWVARYDGPANIYDEAVALTVDSGGNVYVTGNSLGNGIGGMDYATIKYDANGDQLWVARYDGPIGHDYATALAVDASGNVYVTGSSVGPSGSGGYNDYATIKYDANGNQLWVARYNDPENSEDEATALAVDSNGNVYVTGNILGSTSFFDYVTIKYDASGNQIWTARYDGPGQPGSDGDIATALAVDASGNVYVTGFSQSSDTLVDYATVKYDANGSHLWVARYNGPGNDYDDEPAALVVDANGNVYVTGYSVEESSLNGDYATIKYSQAQ